MGLLARMVERVSGVEIVSAAASSRLALTWLSEGKVHIAGSHLEDAKTGEFNLPQIRKLFPDGDFRVVTFASWEEGLVVAAGNPKGIRKVEDLARKGVRFVNREPGSGSRALLDERLGQAGIAGATGAGLRARRVRAPGGGVLPGVAGGGRLRGDAIGGADLRAGFHSAAYGTIRSGDAEADGGIAIGEGTARCVAAGGPAAEIGNAGGVRHVAHGSDGGVGASRLMKGDT